MTGQTHRTTACLCPGCGRKLDAATEMGERGAPSAGDVSVCAYCGMLLVFTDAVTVREMRPAEFDTLSQTNKDALRRISVGAQIAAMFSAPPRDGRA